uniref:Uncharacterized protein n=1 Tax=Oryza nivara TaxID=4536 RepID=A0A0E0GZ15_ORYNI
MATTSPSDLTAAAVTRGRIRFSINPFGLASSSWLIFPPATYRSSEMLLEWSSVNPETTPNSLRTSEECNFRNALCGSSYTRIPNAS